jgi:hypothetical protein
MVNNNLAGGFFYPSEKYELVSWDLIIPNMWNMWKNKQCSKPPTGYIYIVWSCVTATQSQATHDPVSCLSTHDQDNVGNAFTPCLCLHRLIAGIAYVLWLWVTCQLPAIQQSVALNLSAQWQHVHKNKGSLSMDEHSFQKMTAVQIPSL